MAKLKCSTSLSFLHIFSNFSSNFLQIFQMSRTQTVSITGRRMFASTLGRARLLLQWILPVQKYMNQLHGFCVNQWNGFGCVAHKRIYSQWLQRYMMPSVFFVATPERNATATRKEPLWWNGFYSDSLKQKVDQLWEHCTARADPTSSVDANLFFKDVQYWKLKTKLRTIITT